MNLKEPNRLFGLVVNILLGMVVAVIGGLFIQYIFQGFKDSALQVLTVLATLVTLLATTGLALSSKGIASLVRKLQKTPRVFISYARVEADPGLMDQVRGVAAALRSAGALVWIDIENVKPGQRWDDAIVRALANSDIVVAFFSDELETSDTSQVVKEVKVALTEGMTVIPVLIGSGSISEKYVLPSEVAGIRHVDLRTNYDQAVRELIEAIS